MPAKSKKQQKFMGMVHAYQKGELDNPSPAVRSVAQSIKPSDARDFAKTKRKGLPMSATNKEASLLKQANLVTNFILLKQAGLLDGGGGSLPGGAVTGSSGGRTPGGSVGPTITPPPVVDNAGTQIPLNASSKPVSSISGPGGLRALISGLRPRTGSGSSPAATTRRTDERKKE